MIYRRILLALLILFLPFFLLVQSSCEKFSGDQTIPAYLSIDSIYLKTDSLEGTASQNITDAWVYIDDNLIGAFQLPAHFPVLKEGQHNLTVFAGVKKNGIASTRISYPFYNTITQSVNLVPDSTLKVGILKTTYMSTTKFIWQENFENSVSISLDTTKNSMVSIDDTLTGSTPGFEGVRSGIIQMDSEKNFFEIVTHNYFSIPKAPVYIEMNFITNTTFQAGVIVYSADYVIYQTPVLNLAPTNSKWKKIYIDLTTTLNAYPNAINFKVYFGGFMDSTLGHATIFVDNFKLVTR